MLFCDFHAKLKRLNPDLWIDCNNEVKPYHKDFPVAGLYLGKGPHKYLMGVPHNHVPEYSYFGVDRNKLTPEEAAEIDRTGFAPPGVEERMLWRGWKAIVNNLVVRGIVDRKKAEKVFQFSIEERRTEYPHHYIHIEGLAS